MQQNAKVYISILICITWIVLEEESGNELTRKNECHPPADRKPRPAWPRRSRRHQRDDPARASGRSTRYSEHQRARQSVHTERRSAGRDADRAGIYQLGGTRVMDNVIIYDKLEELNEGIEYNGGA